MHSPLIATRRRRYLSASIAAPLLLAVVSGLAATYKWTFSAGTNNNFWDVASNWLDANGNPVAQAPTGTDPSDTLIFQASGGTAYTSLNNGPGGVSGPFQLDSITLASSSTLVTDVIGTTNGSSIRFAGPTRVLDQTGAGPISFGSATSAGPAMESTGTLTLGGTGTGVVTLNGGLMGAFDVIKSGSSVYRFGSASATSYSDNRWIGTLRIDAGPASGTNNNGAIRFNNNAYSAPTALRSNPIFFNGSTASVTTQFKSNNVDPASSLRVGTLSSTGGNGFIEARREDEAFATSGLFDSADIVITALSDGSYSGTIKNTGNAADGNKDSGRLVIRGTATQTFATGSSGMQIEKDVAIGQSATMILSSGASLGSQVSGAIVLNGGTFKLDNSSANNNNRLRDGSGTGLESIGGGKFSLIGNAALGTAEAIATLQLGSSSKPRSGALEINVTHNSGSNAATILTLAGLTRDSGTVAHFTTLDFTANDGAGNAMALGVAGNSPRILFSSSPALSSGGLISSTSAGLSDVGWATVNGTDFATHSGNGVAAVTTTAFSGFNAPIENQLLTTSGSLSGGGTVFLSSLKIAPGTSGQSLSLTSNTDLATQGILLAGSNDFTITSVGTGGIAGSGTRYFQVQQATLTVNAPLEGAAAVVKAGAGTLALTSTQNTLSSAELVINAGAVRATINTLPTGAVDFRGGVLELQGGGTFDRQLGTAANQVNWSGFNNNTVAAIAEDRGSGGFAAVGGDATIDLGGAGQNNFAWEDDKFLNSGFALIFGTAKSDSRVTWTDSISLTAAGQISNYNAREIRVNDNAAVTSDSARMSGVITGGGYDDLMKTGAGTLELTATNTYAGATLVQGGTLLVNKLGGVGGSIAGSFLADVHAGATLGGNGTIGKVRVEDLGNLAPGDAAGHASILHTGDLTFSSGAAKLTIELGGTIAGGDGFSGHDQLQVTGGITLNGATLQGTLLNGFTPGSNDTFYLILNDGTDAVSGTFAGLAEGASLTIGGTSFFISYVANGDGGAIGNDIALSVPEPSIGLLWMAGAGLLGLRRRRISLA